MSAPFFPEPIWHIVFPLLLSGAKINTGLPTRTLLFPIYCDNSRLRQFLFKFPQHIQYLHCVFNHMAKRLKGDKVQAVKRKHHIASDNNKR